jgi:hypothetical protein
MAYRGAKWGFFLAGHGVVEIKGSGPIRTEILTTDA